MSLLSGVVASTARTVRGMERKVPRVGATAPAAAEIGVVTDTRDRSGTFSLGTYHYISGGVPLDDPGVYTVVATVRVQSVTGPGRYYTHARIDGISGAPVADGSAEGGIVGYGWAQATWITEGGASGYSLGVAGLIYPDDLTGWTTADLFIRVDWTRIGPA